MMAARKKKEPEGEARIEVALKQIAAAARRLNKTDLTDDAVEMLIQNMCRGKPNGKGAYNKPSRRLIREVLDNAAELDAYYLKSLQEEQS